MDEATVERLLAEQRRYYRERAPEYDDWWFRRGGYALDTETEARWFADVRELEAALEAFGPRGDVLELAAGTGIWTQRLLQHADRVTAVDAVGEVLELRSTSPPVVVSRLGRWARRRAPPRDAGDAPTSRAAGTCALRDLSGTSCSFPRYSTTAPCCASTSATRRLLLEP